MNISILGTAFMLVLVGMVACVNCTFGAVLTPRSGTIMMPTNPITASKTNAGKLVAPKLDLRPEIPIIKTNLVNRNIPKVEPKPLILRTVKVDPSYEVVLKVADQPVAVRVLMPAHIPQNKEYVITGTNTSPVSITGHVTILYPDDWRIISVQCHWDGVSAKNRHAYSIVYRIGDDGLTVVYSINLACFDSEFTVRGLKARPIVTSISLTPLMQRISFAPATEDRIQDSTSPNDLPF